MNTKERDRYISMMRKKGRKHEGSIFHKPTKRRDLPLEAIKGTVPSVFAKKFTHKLKKVWKRKPKFMEEKKLAFYKLKRKIMAIKTCQNYKRKTKLCKTRSGLFFKLSKIFFLRSFLRYFLQCFLQRFNAKFKILNKNYDIYALNLFLKKVVYLLLKRNQHVLQTRNKTSTKFLAFYFFWQTFLSRFFDIFLRKDFGSGFFLLKLSYNDRCSKSWCIIILGKKRKSIRCEGF